MRCWVGIDLGSTTTKAVALGGDGRLLGRGITNSRSNYKVACDVALSEALLASRFGLVARGLAAGGWPEERIAPWLEELRLRVREAQYRTQLGLLGEGIVAQEGPGRPAAGRILEVMEAETSRLFAAGADRRSDFFRDLAGGRYMALAEEAAGNGEAPFDELAGRFDKAILGVENRPPREGRFASWAAAAVRAMDGAAETARGAVDAAAAVELEPAASVGTGYGRATLPFPKEQIRSEILCHGLGAHVMFEGTRTVLDIGGQDTKAIQVDGDGIVTSFQMNDRCAAGCGRYLGYIADEMNLGVQELGPMACRSRRPVRINSTCTVFAGAELRERLSLGERREDILAGLHRAIILRAMSLIARSGGITDQFTFTGGVARNPAAVAALRGLVEENYGKVTLNISSDSIYTGALGAALFALRGSGRAEREAA